MSEPDNALLRAFTAFALRHRLAQRGDADLALACDAFHEGVLAAVALVKGELDGERQRHREAVERILGRGLRGSAGDDVGGFD